jgi:quinol-cytochrome oxidoreductase complex cytochrome b subunit
VLGRLRRNASRQTWSDLKSSTDASLLGVARFLGLLYGPIDRRLRIDEALHKALQYRLPSHATWRQAFGGITYLLFIILVVTGVLLSFYYRPSAGEAYQSVQHIVSEVSFGWLIRDLHVWSANLIVVAIVAHMARVFFDAAYKPPRETNWLAGLLLLFAVLAFGATGYLLPWDQWAYWTATEVLDALEGVPLFGGALVAVVTGDVMVSGATLSRYFAFHVIIMPWVSFALLAYHFTLVRRRGIAPPRGAPPNVGARKGLSPEDTLSGVHLTAESQKSRPGEGEGIPFFPNHLLRSFIISVVVLAVAISLAALFPRPLGEIANPDAPPAELVSSWVVVDVSLAIIRYLGVWGLALFTLVAVSLALLPLFDRSPESRLSRRPLALTLGVLFIVGTIVAWLVGHRLHPLPPDAVPSAVEQSAAGEAPDVPIPAIGPAPIRPAQPDTSGGGGGNP